MRRALLAGSLGLLSACSAAGGPRDSSTDTSSDRDAMEALASDGAAIDRQDAAMGGEADGGDRLDAGLAPTNGGDAAANSPTWNGVVPNVCDGSRSIRLRFSIVSQPGRTAPGMDLWVQNGSVYWIITGDCHFYVLSSGSGTPPPTVREGLLEAAEAQDIGRRVHFGQALQQRIYNPLEQVVDASTLRLELGDQVVGCYAKCDGAPGEVGDAISQAHDLVAELFDLGSPWTGPMRISVIERPLPPPPSWDPFLIDWPLQVAVEDVSINESDWMSTYRGALIEDADDLRTLRGLAAPLERFAYAWIVRGTERSYFELRDRDAIPLEDVDGVIRSSW